MRPVRLLCGAILVSGCATFGKGANQQGPNSYPLIVNNRSDFEVVVSALPSLEGSGIRLGNARPLATTTLTVPRNVLQASDYLVLNIRCIGAAREVLSLTLPGAQMDTIMVARLDLRAEANGDLKHSTLIVDYPLRPPGAEPVHLLSRAPFRAPSAASLGSSDSRLHAASLAPPGR